jgi:hypothetical protein
MPAKNETISPKETLPVPTPGTLSHLEFLALYPAELPEGAQLSDFLAATQAVRSLGIFIKHLRVYRPITTAYIDFDRRHIVDKKLLSRFTGSIYRNPVNPQHGHISLASEQRLYDGSEVQTYGALLPTHFDFTHDASRRAEAVLVRAQNGRLIRSVYNEAADPDDYQNELNPNVAVDVIRQAASELLGFLGYSPGNLDIAHDIQPAPEGHVYWHPDFLKDDPDEFLKAV